MKKIILGLFVLLLMGAGCFGGGQQQAVEGDWWLAFDLSDDWVMVRPYTPMNGIYLEGVIDRELTDVYVQNTEGTIVYRGAAPESDEDTDEQYVTEDYTLIRVTHLDERRLLPRNAEELRDGFHRVYLCEGEEPGCVPGTGADYDYYYVASNGAKFKFVINQEGQTLDVAEEIIFSAQEVDIAE